MNFKNKSYKRQENKLQIKLLIKLKIKDKRSSMAQNDKL